MEHHSGSASRAAQPQAGGSSGLSPDPMSPSTYSVAGNFRPESSFTSPSSYGPKGRARVSCGDETLRLHIGADTLQRLGIHPPRP
ncbi:hypothetical protein BJX96DRAFT_151714 [Aspergillus floccosus]